MQYKVLMPLIFLVLAWASSNVSAEYQNCECSFGQANFCYVTPPNTCNCRSQQGEPPFCFDEGVIDRQVGAAENGDPIYMCSVRGVPHRAAIVGLEKDMVWIYSGANDLLKPTLRDPIRDGKDLKCNVDVQIGNNYIVTRHGNDRDLWSMYGIRGDGGITAFKTAIRDDKHHPVFLHDGSFEVNFGRNKDRYWRFCFDGSSWTQSAPTRGHTRAGQCIEPAGGTPKPTPKATMRPGVLEEACGGTTGRLCR